ncbi:MAG TPA: cytochrome c peroxidase, partial [Polyangiaceae bacterium]
MKDANAVLAVVRSMPDYVTSFEKAFPEDKDPVAFDNVGEAIGAFERGLVTPSRWDRYLLGDKTALVDAEKKGARVFMETGCANCHNGAYLGGGTLQKLGVFAPWPNQKDQGRFEATKQEADRMMFKVPSLRNVARTGPYFHDASARNLRDPIIEMARLQLGKELAPSDVRLIAIFLSSMTGVVPVDYVKEPALPRSTDRTPKPDAT